MLKKFEGTAGRRQLVDALCEQKIVEGDRALAEELAALVTLVSVAQGEAVIEQGANDDDIYFILSGMFEVRVNNRPIAKRGPGLTIGEMAAVQPLQQRSATVIAELPCVVAKLSESKLTDLGNKYPKIWRFLAKELSRRLLQRNALLAQPRDKVRVFIISSAEALEIARAIQNSFDHDPFTVVIWTDGVFRVANYPIENLERELDNSDFAIAIAQPDDITSSRGVVGPSPRDNVIFELGFFMGRLGRHRAILVEPRGEEIKLPSDLSGIATITYKYAKGSDLAAIMGPACNRIRALINELGPKV